MPVVIRFCVVINLVMALFASCANAGDYPPDIKKILDKKRLVVALTEPDQPPFFMVGKDGALYGFDIELARGIGKELGVEIVFDRSAKTFNDLTDVVNKKHADVVISKLSKTLTRSKRLLFTEPYIVLRKGLLINRLKLARMKGGADTAEFVKKIRGDIGVIAGSSYQEFAKRMFPNANIRPYKTWDDVIRAVTGGEILAAFRDEIELKKVIKTQPDVALKLQTVVFKDTEDPIAMAVSWDNPHLQYWLNQYLQTYRQDINADKLLERYNAIFESK